VGKRLPALNVLAIEWVREWVGEWERDGVRVISALHHTIDRVENLSLDGIRHYDLETVSIIISSLSFFSLLFLNPSQSTISLRLLPPNAPQNKMSVFVACYGSYGVRSPDSGLPPQRLGVIGGVFRLRGPSCYARHSRHARCQFYRQNRQSRLN